MMHCSKHVSLHLEKQECCTKNTRLELKAEQLLVQALKNTKITWIPELTRNRVLRCIPADAWLS